MYDIVQKAQKQVRLLFSGGRGGTDGRGIETMYRGTERTEQHY